MSSVNLSGLACFRVIGTRVPSADLFQGIADFGEWEEVAEIEALHNERNRVPLGNLGRIPKAERAFGPGSSYIMAPFAYPAPGRFGDGRNGVLYAALDEATALREVAFHRALFFRQGRNPRETSDQQILSLIFDGAVEDIRGMGSTFPMLYDPNDWSAGQAFAAVAMSQGLDGIAYDSVRNRGGECVAGFRPKAFSQCRHVRPEQFFWDGHVLHGPGGIRF